MNLVFKSGHNKFLREYKKDFLAKVFLNGRDESSPLAKNEPYGSLCVERSKMLAFSSSLATIRARVG